MMSKYFPTQILQCVQVGHVISCINQHKAAWFQNDLHTLQLFLAIEKGHFLAQKMQCDHTNSSSI